jgi:hypothetical protein
MKENYRVSRENRMNRLNWDWIIEVGLFEELSLEWRPVGWLRVSQTENEKNSMSGKSLEMEKCLARLKNWKKASFPRKSGERWGWGWREKKVYIAF